MLCICVLSLSLWTVLLYGNVYVENGQSIGLALYQCCCTFHHTNTCINEKCDDVSIGKFRSNPLAAVLFVFIAFHGKRNRWHHWQPIRCFICWESIENESVFCISNGQFEHGIITDECITMSLFNIHELLFLIDSSILNLWWIIPFILNISLNYIAKNVWEFRQKQWTSQYKIQTRRLPPIRRKCGLWPVCFGTNRCFFIIAGSSPIVTVAPNRIYCSRRSETKKLCRTQCLDCNFCSWDLIASVFSEHGRHNHYNIMMTPSSRNKLYSNTQTTPYIHSVDQTTCEFLCWNMIHNTVSLESGNIIHG